MATQTRPVTTAPTATPTTRPPSTPTVTPAAAATSESPDSSTPAWLWWVLGLLVLAGGALTALLLRRRRRKRAWADKLGAATDEVTWFARVLIPRLAQAPTAQQMAGGWRIESARVVTVEDHLTALEAAAVDDVGRTQARTLRDAVRASRVRLDTLGTAVTAGGADTARDTRNAVEVLRHTALDLESALATVEPGTGAGRLATPPVPTP